MSDSKKTIVVNKEFLSPKKNKNPKNKTIKNKISVNPQVLKNKLLKKIKHHKTIEQKAAGKKEPIVNQSTAEDDMDEFKKSFNFINNFATGSSSSIGNPKTLKKPIHASKSSPPVHLEMPVELEIPEQTFIPSPNSETFDIKIPKMESGELPYGCLKGGNKPTYRTWNKTIKRDPTFEQEDKIIKYEKPKIDPTDKKNRIKKLHERLTSIEKMENKKLNPVNKKKTKRTITKKFTIGRSKNGGSIGILIKDRKTRKKIIDAQKEMKKKDINEIKKYLYDHGFIKVGSVAPSNVLRQMYESTMLTGDVTNVQDGVLLENINNKEEF